MTRVPDLLVVGGGVIGCAVAFYAARLGLSVTLLDSAKRGRATAASAGGLWPVGESYGLGCGVIFHKREVGVAPPTLPECFVNFAMTSARMFPDLSREVKGLCGVDVEFERTSLLFLVYDEADAQYAQTLRQQASTLRTRVDWLEPGELVRAEPWVTPEAHGALRLEGEDQVNPYRLADGMRAAAQALGAHVELDAEVAQLVCHQGRVRGVRTKQGQLLSAGQVVNAAGVWARQLAHTIGLDVPVHPVRGQIVCTETLPAGLRACISTSDCYLAQKRHGEVIIGSTTEHVGFDTGVTSAAICRLAAGAVRALPVLRQVQVKRVWSGLRPGSPDELPILGQVPELPGYLNACGHFRTGVVNAPLSGLVLAEAAAEQPLSFPIEPFALSRFARHAAREEPARAPGNGAITVAAG